MWMGLRGLLAVVSKSGGLGIFISPSALIICYKNSSHLGVPWFRRGTGHCVGVSGLIGWPSKNPIEL